MSWSINRTGKPAAVIAAVQKDVAGYKCKEPEETMRQAAVGIIVASLGAMPSDSAVKVEAHGSQSGEGPTDVSNNFKLLIEPIFGFVVE